MIIEVNWNEQLEELDKVISNLKELRKLMYLASINGQTSLNKFVGLADTEEE